MKIRIAVTLELTEEQVKFLTKEAKESGHDFDGTKAPGKLIKRLLLGVMMDTITYARERAEKEDR